MRGVLTACEHDIVLDRGGHEGRGEKEEEGWGTNVGNLADFIPRNKLCAINWPATLLEAETGNRNSTCASKKIHSTKKEDDLQAGKE